jgi:MurNAc alpha-1-phosphate uridylyltransferase
MILAAGLGTRLRPVTDTIPKALVEVGGVPMIERVARRLVAAGADRLIVNVHHHADRLEAFLDDLAGALGVEIAVSREEDGPLDTGGGLLRAAPLFRGDAPFLLHNVDVITEIDLESMVAAHGSGAGIATLAVHERDTSRFLLFDDQGLFGWENAARGAARTVRDPRGAIGRLGFAGIHVVSANVPSLLAEAGYRDDAPFSILEGYLRLAGEGHAIAPHDVTGVFWIEVGTPERLARAEELLATARGRSDGG